MNPCNPYDVLQASGVLHRQPHPHKDEKDEQNDGNQDLHGHKVGNGSLPVSGLDVQGMQQGQRHAAEILIQESGKRKLFHKSR